MAGLFCFNVLSVFDRVEVPNQVECVQDCFEALAVMLACRNLLLLSFAFFLWLIGVSEVVEND